jgi:dihydrofolate reductase
MSFTIIVAIDKNNGIGKNNQLAWNLSADLKHFAKTTKACSEGKQNAIIMGRNTWLSLPLKPLPNRLNIVLSDEPLSDLPDEVKIASSFTQALELAGTCENVFVIGGANVYAQVINHPDCQYLEITELEQDFNCDTFFPTIPDWYKKIYSSEMQTENEINFRFCRYQSFPELKAN